MGYNAKTKLIVLPRLREVLEHLGKDVTLFARSSLNCWKASQWLSISSPPTSEPSSTISSWGFLAFQEKDSPTVLVPANTFSSENQKHSLLWLCPLAMGLTLWSDKFFSIFNIFDRQNSNLTKLGFLLIIFHTTDCYLGTPTRCVKPHLHGEGIYNDEMKATQKWLQVKERYLWWWQ